MTVDSRRSTWAMAPATDLGTDFPDTFRTSTCSDLLLKEGTRALAPARATRARAVYGDPALPRVNVVQVHAELSGGLLKSSAWIPNRRVVAVTVAGTVNWPV